MSTNRTLSDLIFFLWDMSIVIRKKRTKQRMRKKPFRVLRSDEVDLMFNNVPSRYNKDPNNMGFLRWHTNLNEVIKRDLALIAFLYLYGMRINELLSLKIGDVWINKPEEMLRLTIPVEKRGESYNHIVEVRLDAPYMNYIKDYLMIFKDEEKVFKDKKKNEKLFNLSDVSCWYIVSHALKGAYPHILRRGRVNRLCDKAANMRELMSWFGWKSAQTAGEYLDRFGANTRHLGKTID